jgi:hypothetical protein
MLANVLRERANENIKERRENRVTQGRRKAGTTREIHTGAKEEKGAKGA